MKSSTIFVSLLTPHGAKQSWTKRNLQFRKSIGYWNGLLPQHPMQHF